MHSLMSPKAKEEKEDKDFQVPDDKQVTKVRAMPASFRKQVVEEATDLLEPKEQEIKENESSDGISVVDL